MTELVKISKADHVADVRLNRPEKYNALSDDMFEAIAETIKDLSKDTTIRAVVLSGEGKGFCAGLDFDNFKAIQSIGNVRESSLVERYEDRTTNLYQFVAYGWKQLPMPVIAAVHGVAFGGGCQIALGADIRLSSPDARLSIREINWGLIPDMSASQTLRQLVSIDVAKELIFTGKIVSGEEAARLNLVTRCCEDPYQEAVQLASEIASKSPHAVRAAKKLLNETWYCDTAAGLRLESELEMTVMGSKNQLEAVAANFENRAPLFEDP